MLRLGLLVLVAAVLGACAGDPYVKNESSAAAGGTAAAPLMVRFVSDRDGKEKVLPTDYPNFHSGDKAKVLQNGKVGPL